MVWHKLRPEVIKKDEPRVSKPKAMILRSAEISCRIG